jgi:hypothetical protein
VKKILGEKAIALLEKANKVEAFRIEEKQTQKTGDDYIAGYRIIGKSKNLGEKFPAKLRAALFEEKIYFGQAARCFDPGVAFRIWHDKQAIEVVICFHCTNFTVGMAGEKAGSHGFGPRLEPFLALAKEAFPDDADIQGLKSK